MAICLIGLPIAATAQQVSGQAENPDLTRQQVATFDQFLDSHPQIAQQLQANPSLINNAEFLEGHPQLQAFLTSHPELSEELKENPMRIAIASDHAGFQLKELLMNRLAAEPDLTLVDLGTHASSPPVDYPDYAEKVGEAVRDGLADRGVLVCGSGAGVAVAACKMAGIRAVTAHDTYTAHQSVEQPDAAPDAACASHTDGYSASRR